ncbi:MAG: cryptochrome/photolyase family protein [Bacteroidales bacterium]
MNKDRINIFWFRRDLRLEDNHALWQALQSKFPVLPIFIFDEHFFKIFAANDKRFNLIYDQLQKLDRKLKDFHSGISIFKGNVLEIFHQLTKLYDVEAVFCNEDYEPFAIKRDKEVKHLLEKKGIPFLLFKDQVIFHKDEVTKEDQKPYTVFTHYKNKWLSLFKSEMANAFPSEKMLNKLYHFENRFPEKTELGIISNTYKLKPLILEHLNDYEKYRDFPALDRTSNASVYLRFGFVSIRKMVRETIKTNMAFLTELIWREFFMQILYHYPHVEHKNFKSQYDKLEWVNNEKLFERWCNGQTGYPMVDAGMRELNTTGYMHNRVRMITASFLCKHLLIDWTWGENYFAQHLLDYDLSANNGNWQWAASTGCDAVPYFRIFNPNLQIQRFDKNLTYIKKWVPEYGTSSYPKPIVEHSFARQRALNAFSKITMR